MIKIPKALSIVLPSILVCATLVEIWVEPPIADFPDKLGKTFLANVVFVILIIFYQVNKNNQKNLTLHFASCAFGWIFISVDLFHVWVGLPLADAQTKLEETGLLTLLVMAVIFGLNANKRFWSAGYHS